MGLDPLLARARLFDYLVGVVSECPKIAFNLFRKADGSGKGLITSAVACGFGAGGKSVTYGPGDAQPTSSINSSAVSSASLAQYIQSTFVISGDVPVLGVVFTLNPFVFFNAIQDRVLLVLLSRGFLLQPSGTFPLDADIHTAGAEGQQQDNPG